MNLSNAAIVALARHFDRDQSHVKEARAALTKGEYDVDAVLRLEGLLDIGEDYEQVKSSQVSGIKALTYMVHVLLQDETLACSKQKALALVTKALEAAINPEVPMDSAQEKLIKKELGSIRKRFTAAIGFRTQRGPSKFCGVVHKQEAEVERREIPAPQSAG